MDRSTVVLSARAGLFLSPQPHTHTNRQRRTRRRRASTSGSIAPRPPRPTGGLYSARALAGRGSASPSAASRGVFEPLVSRGGFCARRVLTLPAPRLLDLLTTTTFGLDGGVRLPHLAEDVLLGVLPLASEQVSASTSEVEDDAVAHLLRHSRLLDARVLLAIWSRHTRRESMRACAAQRM